MYIDQSHRLVQNATHNNCCKYMVIRIHNKTFAYVDYKNMQILLPYFFLIIVNSRNKKKHQNFARIRYKTRNPEKVVIGTDWL